MRKILVLALAAILLAGCGGGNQAQAGTAPWGTSQSYAIYAEYARDSNQLMQPGLNRRVFNKVEAQNGTDISLSEDGVVTVEPGTYRITGFSLVTMQDTFAPPVPQHDNNYPGYCLLYPLQFENDIPNLLPNAICIGSPATAQDTAPSLIDCIYMTGIRSRIALGHQSGEDLNDEVFLSVYSVAGIPSDYHVFARLAITRL